MSNFIQIDNGSAIDVAWTGTIAISIDGTNWSTYPKNQIKVGVENVDTNSADPNKIPYETSGRRVVIRNINNNELIARFLPGEVLNQSWTTITTAINDINTWIGEVYP